VSDLDLLSEHEAPPSEKDSTDKNATYTPSDDEKKAIKLVNKMYDKAKKGRKKYDDKWLDYYRMYRGKQWKEKRPAYRHSEVINLIFRSINSQVPILTDIRPRFEYLPQEPGDFELAEIINQLAECDWEKKNWGEQFLEDVYDSHIYGTGLGDMGYEQDREIYYDSFDPFYFFPDPSARNVNNKCKFVVTAEPTDVSELKEKYPDKAKYIKSDLIDLAGSDKTNIGEIKYQSPVDNRVLVEGESGYDLGEGHKVLKITLWTHSSESIEEEKKEVGEDGLEKLYYENRLKYPKGRKVVIANGVLLEDGENPYEDGKFPFARLVNYVDPRSFWGISDIEQAESPQKTFNKLVSFALDVLTLMGNPIWVVDNTSGVDTDNLFNRPGLVVEKEPSSEVRREAGISVDPSVLRMIDNLKMWFDDITGSTDSSRGVKPEGVTAASAIQALQETSQTRLRQKSRNIDSFLQDLGQLYLSRVFQFYTVPRVVRLTNNNDGAVKYFKMHIETDEAGSKKVHVRDFVHNTDTNQISEQLEAKTYPVQGSFDVRVTTGSSLPFAKKEKFDIAMQLYQVQAIDQEELLKSAEYPNWEAVMARMQQKAMEQAQMQAQQPQGGPPPAA